MDKMTAVRILDEMTDEQVMVSGIIAKGAEYRGFIKGGLIATGAIVVAAIAEPVYHIVKNKLALIKLRKM